MNKLAPRSITKQASKACSPGFSPSPSFFAPWLSAIVYCPLAIAVLAGCTVGPDYKRPAAEVPTAYTGATNAWKTAQPQADLPKGNWWEIFNDSELNGLETNAAASNQELKAVAARFEQARAYTDIARSGLFPHIGASANATRERDSFNRPATGNPAHNSPTYNNFSTPLDFSYELDLWGRVRRGMESAKANQKAAAADAQAVGLAIQAEIAADYFALHTLDAELATLRSSVAVFSKSVDLTHNRRAGGIASDLDVAQAESVLKATEAQIPTVRLERVKLQHALAVLTGKPASSFQLSEAILTRTSLQIPAGIPSQLLERRPDIAIAEENMRAANAAVGVAKTAFYPTIRLTGVAGLQSVDTGTFFDWPSRFWAVGPSLSFPLFEGGRLRADERRSKAKYDETVANYRQTVLVAFAEVEDNLCAQDLLTEATEAQTSALQAARKTLEIANNRYRSGLVTYLEVATSQTSALNSERETIRLRGQQLITAVALAKSLGGTW